MSKLKVSAIHDPDNDNEAITVDTSGNVTFSQNATFSGTVTGIEGLPDAIDVNASAPADSLNIDSSGVVQIGPSGSTGDRELRFETGSGSASGEDAIINSYRTNADLIIKTNDTECMRITNDGRGLSQFTAKVWINFNGTGTVAIRDSHNVSSITDTNTGTYRINFSNNLANSNYATVGTTSNVNNNFSVDDPSHPTTSSVVVQTRDVESNTNEDGELISALIFGD